MNPMLLDRVLVFSYPRLPTEKPLPGMITALHPDGTIDAVVFADKARHLAPAARIIGPIPVLEIGVDFLPDYRGSHCAYLMPFDESAADPTPAREPSIRTRRRGIVPAAV